MGQKLDNTEYDPRIGFRLKKQPEHDTVVFKCPTTGLKWTSTYLTPYYDDRKFISLSAYFLVDSLLIA